MVSWRLIAVLLALAVLSGCASVRYQRSGHAIEPRSEETLVFGRVRFFHDGEEFFPWEPRLVPQGIGTDTERHLWLLRLDERAVSPEVHPDSDGSLAIWLARGDYALLGSTRLPDTGTPPYEVVALLRVPAATVAYGGDLILKTESHEGGHLSFGELGASAVDLLPSDAVRTLLERKFGTLPDSLVRSPWCAGERLPGFSDAHLADRTRELLDRGCDARGPS